MAVIRTSAGLLGLLVCASLFVSAFAQPQKLMFAFGDSYADTGNRPKSGINEGRGWMYPYGITWPGYPNGRYSDGKVQTDYYADLLGIPYAPPYLYAAGQSTAAGVNFAVAGSGITYAYGEQPLGGQVDSFELFLRTSPYSKQALANSLTLVAETGNDYITFNGTSSEFFIYIERVVAGIEASVQRLYDLGLRDIMVCNLPSVGCFPQFTAPSNYQTCNATFEPYVQIHNAFLQGAVQSLNAQNPGARIIILDQYAAFGLLYRQPSAGGFTDKLVPCCNGINSTTLCGDKDASGKPLYTVCKHRGKAVFWDNHHPTMWAWHYVVNLYITQPQFLLLANDSSLPQWLQLNAAVMAPVSAPMAPPGYSGALGQWEAAHSFLLSKPMYSEALGLVESLNLEVLLSPYPQSVVTLFLPNNAAFLAADTVLIDRLVSQDKVNSVGLYHTAQGYFDANTLLTTKPPMLTTLSGAQLPVNYTSQGIFLGPAATAKVVDPNLYVVAKQVVIHGIDHLIIPQGA